MEEFAAKVAEMLRLQKEYFKSRDPYTLQACKKAEREVDYFLDNGKPPAKKQDNASKLPTLF